MRTIVPKTSIKADDIFERYSTVTKNMWALAKDVTVEWMEGEREWAYGNTWAVRVCQLGKHNTVDLDLELEGEGNLRKSVNVRKTV